jgi:hypothetical protein
MAVRLVAAHPAPLHADPMVVARLVLDGKGIVVRLSAVPKVSDCPVLSKALRPRAAAQLALLVGPVRQSDARPRAALRVLRVSRLSVPRASRLDGRREQKFRAPQEKQEDASPAERLQDEPR